MNAVLIALARTTTQSIRSAFASPLSSCLLPPESVKGFPDLFNQILDYDVQPDGDTSPNDGEKADAGECPKATSRTRVAKASKEGDSEQASSRSGSGPEMAQTACESVQSTCEKILPSATNLGAEGLTDRVATATEAAPSTKDPTNQLVSVQSGVTAPAPDSAHEVAFLLNLTWQRSPTAQHRPIASTPSVEPVSRQAMPTPDTMLVPSSKASSLKDVAPGPRPSGVAQQGDANPFDLNVSRPNRTNSDRTDAASAKPSVDQLSVPETTTSVASPSPAKENQKPNSSVVQQAGRRAPSANTDSAASAHEETHDPQPTELMQPQFKTVAQLESVASADDEQRHVQFGPGPASSPKSAEVQAQPDSSIPASNPKTRSAVRSEGREGDKTDQAESPSLRNRDGSEASNSEPKAPIKDKTPSKEIGPVYAVNGSGQPITPGGSSPARFERQAISKPPTEDSPSSPAAVHQLENSSITAARPVRTISLQLGTSASDKVDVQVATRGGKIQVAVRTPDQDLAKSLQGNLGDLVSRLEDKGFKTEAWTPSGVPHSTNIKDPASAENTHSQSENPGSGSGSQGRQDAQQQSGQRQPGSWKEELEETLAAPDALTYEEEAF